MLLSMTGFGKAVIELPNKKIIAEIKSLNSKQLDMSMRVPALLREAEMQCRQDITHKLQRGKVEANIYIETQPGESVAQFNIALLSQYRNKITEIANILGIPEPTDWYATLLRLPDVMKADTANETATSAEIQAAIQAMDQASDALMSYRAAEGTKLEEFFTHRIEKIRELLAQIPQYEIERVAHIRSRIIDNLSKLPQVEYDRGRLEQEMIFYIEKLDINEEKQRLTQHLNYFIETLNGPIGQGKKLGFISQEMGREINTLGSKSNHAEMQKIVVKMKDELEQIKEQVLNVM